MDQVYLPGIDPPGPEPLPLLDRRRERKRRRKEEQQDPPPPDPNQTEIDW